MDLSIPLIPKESSLHSDWTRLEHGANAALVKCTDGHSETLIYVVFGDDFIAGLRVDRKTWILLPARAVSVVTLKHLGAAWLPPIRQTSEQARSYLQGLGSIELRVRLAGDVESQPPALGSIHGQWLIMSRTDDAAPERMAAFDSIALIEVLDVASVVSNFDFTRIGGVA
jgi:hypothetical protein